MPQMRATQKQRVRNGAEKEKINRDYEAKISDLKKSHVVERQQMNDRHRNDAEQVKKATQAPAPPAKKKKIDQE